MQRKIFVVLLLSMMLIITGTSWAHHPVGSGGLGRSGPIRTFSATPLQQGQWSASLHAEYIDFKSFSDNELTGYAEEGQEVHTTDSILHTVFGIYYGVTENFTLGVRLPYESLNNIREAHHEEEEGGHEVHDRGDSQGVGDLILAGQYRFVNDKARSIESSLVFGLKVPTGTTSEKDNDGERFETEFQPGTGAWSPFAGIAVTKRYGPVSLDAHLQYLLTTEGAQDAEMGDEFSYNAAVSYRAYSDKDMSWDIALELNGEWQGKEKVAGVKDENSGGNTVFISPGVRFSYKNLSAFVSVGFPVIEDLNGIQNEISTKTVFGMGLTF